MPFQLIRENITEINVDVIVNPTDSYFSHRGGTEKQIHDAAGSKLYEECKTYGKLNTSEVFMTSSYDMKNTKHIIHTVGPIYKDGKHNENEYLYNCYKNSLDLAKENHFESIAFPLIGSGTFSFPKGEALRIATSAITDFLVNNEMYIYLLVFDNSAFDISKKIFTKVDDYLNKKPKINISDADFSCYSLNFVCYEETIERKPSKTKKKNFKINDVEINIEVKPDEAFYEYLRRKLNEKGLTDSIVYNAVNMDRSVFNNIVNGRRKSIQKESAVAIAIGMKLNMKETKELVEKSGNSFTGDCMFDKVIKACIAKKIYKINDVNEVLFFYDQPTLGTKSK